MAYSLQNHRRFSTNAIGGCCDKNKKICIMYIIILLCNYHIRLHICNPYLYENSWVHLSACDPGVWRRGDEFFSENQEELTQLAEYQSKISDDTCYLYTFHIHTFDSPRIPEEIKNVLLNLEKKLINNIQFPFRNMKFGFRLKAVQILRFIYTLEFLKNMEWSRKGIRKYCWMTSGRCMLHM